MKFIEILSEIFQKVVLFEISKYAYSILKLALEKTEFLNVRHS